MKTNCNLERDRPPALNPKCFYVFATVTLSLRALFFIFTERKLSKRARYTEQSRSMIDLLTVIVFAKCVSIVDISKYKFYYFKTDLQLIRSILKESDATTNLKIPLLQSPKFH